MSSTATEELSSPSANTNGCSFTDLAQVKGSAAVSLQRGVSRRILQCTMHPGADTPLSHLCPIYWHKGERGRRWQLDGSHHTHTQTYTNKIN